MSDLNRSDLAIEPKNLEEGKYSNDGPLETNESSVSAGLNESDYEKHGAGPESTPVPDLKRRMKSRHLQMIAIGASLFFFFFFFFFFFSTFFSPPSPSQGRGN